MEDDRSIVLKRLKQRLPSFPFDSQLMAMAHRGLEKMSLEELLEAEGHLNEAEQGLRKLSEALAAFQKK